MVGKTSGAWVSCSLLPRACCCLRGAEGTLGPMVPLRAKGQDAGDCYTQSALGEGVACWCPCWGLARLALSPPGHTHPFPAPHRTSALSTRSSRTRCWDLASSASFMEVRTEASGQWERQRGPAQDASQADVRLLASPFPLWCRPVPSGHECSVRSNNLGFLVTSKVSLHSPPGPSLVATQPGL